MSFPSALQSADMHADAPLSSQWKNWLVDHALPLWSDAGFDPQRRLYNERLSWTGKALPMGELRLMVQARQISTYCRAYLDGLFDAREQALACLEEVEKRYHQADGAPGWVFSLAADGTPASTVRDLYGHAFILFAYAWAYKLTKNPAYAATARQTVLEIDQIFAAQPAGYFTSVPGLAEERSQNPHMHLLEAYLSLFEATEEAFYLEHAKKLVHLTLERFIDPKSGCLLEFFDATLSPLHPWGGNRVEPGHQFEWSWLLSEYKRLAAPNEKLAEKFVEKLDKTADRLFENGFSGVDKGSDIVWDALTENGTPLEKNTRIWPQTEFLRVIMQRKRDRRSAGPADLAARVTSNLFQDYLDTELEGGWIDRIDTIGKPMVDYMPASSLYHIYGAARELVLLPNKLFDEKKS